MRHNYQTMNRHRRGDAMPMMTDGGDSGAGRTGVLVLDNGVDGHCKNKTINGGHHHYRSCCGYEKCWGVYGRI